MSKKPRASARSSQSAADAATPRESTAVKSSEVAQTALTPRYPVVSLVLRRGDHFLIGKRSLTESAASGYWCAISGGMEPGETEEQTLIREADEEIGVKIRPVRKLGELDTRNGRIRLYWWLAEIESGEPYLKNDEHSELRWVTLDEFRALKPIFEENVALFALALQD